MPGSLKIMPYVWVSETPYSGRKKISLITYKHSPLSS